MILEGREPGDGLAPKLERRHPVEDPLIFIGNDRHDRVPELRQGAPLRF
jgi:hypothetical protein